MLSLDRLFAGFDVAPDGQRFLVNLRGDKWARLGTPRCYDVQNFLWTVFIPSLAPLPKAVTKPEIYFALSTLALADLEPSDLVVLGLA